MKMVTIKKHAMALVALAIAASSVTLMSFGKTEVNTSKSQSSYWYQVTPNPSNPDDDLVTTTLASPTNSPECSTDYEGTPRCAVELNQPITSPMTIEEIELHPTINKGEERFSAED